ncbi:hypothetical protein [Noviherbaspirillum massiliense]|uniref:hypothetical protein n=1 Tax=Noviherbaspirillum massiliense TaxID=1465823 RepID=UPI0002D48DBA|nr:hypothetical protein [Noviherbaspirillum massiliense]
MATDPRAIEQLLKDVQSLLEVTEDLEINVVPPDDPLRQQARDLGIAADGRITFGELRTAIERKMRAVCGDGGRNRFHQ